MRANAVATEEQYRLIMECRASDLRAYQWCLGRCCNKGTEEESVNYHCDVLEAKIVLGESLVVSIGSEFIENNGEDGDRRKDLSEGKRKQDCETKAFKRLAGKIKKAFPGPSILLLADSLYALEPVMDICSGGDCAGAGMFCVGSDDGEYRRKKGMRYHSSSCQSRVLCTAPRQSP